LNATRSLTVRSASTYGDLSTYSGGLTAINSLVSTAGRVTADSAQALRLTSVIGQTGVTLSSVQGLSAKSLMSDAGAISLTSSGGDVSINNTLAYAGISGTASTSLQLLRFNVSNGGATMSAGTTMSFKAGTVRGNVDAQSGQAMVLGSLISETGTVVARSTHSSVSFSSLMAYGDVTLDGEAGNTEAPAVSGSSLTTQGGLTVTASSGSATFKSLVAGANSSFDLDNGSLRISRISGITRGAMSILVDGGSVSLPRNF